MDSIIVVSICEKYINKSSLVGYEFHFYGYFRGNRINKISVRTDHVMLIGGEYLLYLSAYQVKGTSLIASLISSTRLIKRKVPY